jgi:hypothetical protein
VFTLRNHNLNNLLRSTIKVTEKNLYAITFKDHKEFLTDSGLWQFQTCAAGNNNTLFDPRAPEIPSQPRRSSRPHREAPHPPGSIYEGQSRTQIEHNTNADGSTSNRRFPAPTVEEADDDIETNSIEFSFDDQYANHLDNENSPFKIFIQDISTTAEAKTPSKDPQSYKDAVSHPDKAQWLIAMQSEMQSHADNGTWEIVDPKGKNIRNILGNWWVLVKKRDGRYKGHLIVQGFGQKHRINYDETFSPVVRYETVCFILTKVCVEDWDLESMDVSTAFLNGELNQEIYMKQPEGFIVKGKEHCICCLRKALYGLKQGSRQWYKKLDETLRGKLHFTQTYADAGIYVLRSRGGDLEIILIVYVDNILLTGPNSKRIKEIMQKLSSYFKMKLLGSPSDFLSLCIERDRSN